MARNRKRRKKKKNMFRTLLLPLGALLMLFLVAIVLLEKMDISLPGVDREVPYHQAIVHAAAEQELDPALVAAVIRQESNFTPDAVSRVGAQGLMQIMPQTAPDIARMMGREGASEDLFNPDINMQYGTTFLRYLLDRFDQVPETALAAYNAGPTIVANWLKDSRYSADGRTLHTIPYGETRHYVQKVMEYYRSYQSSFSSSGSRSSAAMPGLVIS